MNFNFYTSKCWWNILIIMVLAISSKGFALEKNHINSIITDTIKGQVITNTNKPIPAATITVNKQGTAALTDGEGRFSLPNIPYNSQIIVSAEGYKTKYLKLIDINTLRIQLDTNIIAIKAIEVVSNGYQSTPKKRMTGSVTEPLEGPFSSRKTTDILSKLEGITLGLVFSKSATNAPGIIIRGISSIKANQNPLIVVDNFPYEGDIFNINPDDVESIVVLKDAATAAIWGARSGNGVIVITTKKGGLNQKPKIEFSFNSTFQAKPRLEGSRDFIPASDFIDLEIQLFQSGYYDRELSNLVDMPPISPVVEILSQQKRGLLTPTEAALQIEAFRQNDIRKEIKKYFMRHGFNQQYHFGLTGGGNKHSYALSLGIDNNDQATKGNNFRRYTGSLNLTSNHFKNLGITAGVYYSNTRTTEDQTLGKMFTDGALGKGRLPYAMLMNKNGQPASMVKDLRQTFKDTAMIGHLLDWNYYPLKDQGLNVYTNDLMNIRMNLGLTYNINEALNVKITYQYQRNTSLSETWYDPESYFSRNFTNKFTNITPSGAFVPQIPLGGQLDVINKYAYAHNLRGQVNFNKKWKAHNLVMMGGTDIQDLISRGFRGYFYGYDRRTNYHQPLRQNSFELLLSGEQETISDNNAVTPYTYNRFRSYFGNVTYAYDGKYIFTASLRNDRANLLGSDIRDVPLWSMGARWNISDENFFKAGWISLLALRASYGYNGNLRPSIPTQTIAIPVRSSPFQPASIEIQDIGNSQISWERLGIFNIGVDFSLLASRISGTLEFYRKNGTDLVGTNTIAPSLGAPSMLDNYAHMQGHGFDLMLNTKNVKGNDFLWSSNFLLSHARDKITDYMEDDNMIIVGRPIYSIYSLKSAGLDPQNGNPIGYLEGVKSTEYTKILDKTKTIDKEYNGPATPTWWAGFNNTIEYSSLSFGVSLSYKGGYSFRRKSIQYFSLTRSWNGHEDYLLRWQKPGDELLTKVPSLSIANDAGPRDKYYSESSALVEKGDHMRIQDIRLGYTINGKKIPFNKMQLYFNINNIGVIWRANKLGIDPDNPMGIPNPRSFTFGIKLSL